MSLNYLEIEQILKELNLEETHLQKVKAIDYESFVFFFYKPGTPINVFVSLDKNCRIHRHTKKIDFLGKPHNLVEYLKAYLVGGKVIKTEQVNKNRIIKIQIDNRGITYFLFIRLWGGYSNIIITTPENEIIHLHKKSSKKSELPCKKFILPTKLNIEKEYKLKEHGYDNYNSFIENEYIKLLEKQRIINEELKTETLKNRRLKEINRQIKTLESRLEGYLKADIYKLYADLILSNIYLINKGDEVLEVNDYNTGDLIKIKITPELEPHQNSEFYYKKYRKAVQGVNKTKAQIKDLINERKNPIFNSSIQRTNIKNNITESKPGLHYNSDGWDILVGRTAKENEALLRSYVKGNDMWLHVRDFPGGYVFIKSKKSKTFPLNILLDAGTLALYYSKGKTNGRADIMYTQVKHLRKIKKGKPGQVIASNDKNIHIILDKKRLDSLKP